MRADEGKCEGGSVDVGVGRDLVDLYRVYIRRS